MLCPISGEPVKEPVLSPKSKTIFEKKTIVNYISTAGTDPITNDPLTIEELIPINTQTKNIVPPVAPRNTSIPALLSTFQNEWDSIVLELFTLRKQLQSAREELSAALYRQDAAVRVAAKAIKERDEAKEALEKLAVSLSATNGEEQPSVQDKLDLIASTRDDLFKLHKSRKIKLNFPVDAILKLNWKSELIVGDTIAWGVDNVNKTMGFITDKGFVEYKMEADRIQKEWNKKYTNFFYKNGIVIPWNDHLIKFDHYRQLEFEDTIDQVICHPTLNIYIVLTTEPSLIVCDDTTKITSYSLKDHLSLGKIKSAIHVDGEIVALASESSIILISIITGNKLASLQTNAPVKKLMFASNGYWLFALTDTVELFDLRTAKRIKQFDQKVDDFVIDPSSSVLVTVANEKFSIARYSKKKKEWQFQESEEYNTKHSM
ncbi:uncharacterized protein SPAPADRAFT_62450, partial [Spathaspora passalidarum NRRL Y-27907]